MAMSITEANQINVLLDWLLNVDGGKDWNGPTSWEDARLAAAGLAAQAYKRLSAGHNQQGVLALWDVQNAKGALRSKRLRRGAKTKRTTPPPGRP